MLYEVITSLKPAALKLADLLGQPVPLAPDCVGPEVKKMVDELKDGEVILLENVRFHEEEELLNKYAKQDDATKARIDAFCKELASYGDVYVNDAFGTAHRAHGSTEGVTKYIDTCVAGFLMEKEVRITSYNVCYTKLLRLSHSPGLTGQPEPL